MEANKPLQVDIIGDLTDVSHGFPQQPDRMIPRDHILDTIETMFLGGVELVVVEGPEGVGRTTLLSEFARRHGKYTFSLFIRPVGRLAYDPTLINFDLCNQLEWLLHGRMLQSAEEVREGFAASRFAELHRRFKMRRESFYFVVDGLQDIPASDSIIVGSILDLLPFNMSGFKFLISGDVTQLPEMVRKHIRHKPLPLSPFSLDESLRYFGDLPAERADLEEICKICKGMPTALASIRRSVESGSPLHTILQELHRTLPQPFELEWSTVNINDPMQADVLSILAHARRTLSPGELARLLGVNIEQIEQSVRPFSFLTWNVERQEVRYVSEAFRRFASEKLDDRKAWVDKILIDDLLKQPHSPAALAYLPGYLEEAGRWDELLSFLSPATFTRLLTNGQSLSPAKQRAQLAVGTSWRHHRDSDLIRFSMQSSVLEELESAEVWRSEVEARLALNDIDAALAIAQSVVLKEERLHLLAIVAKRKPELSEQIRQLYAQIDHTTLRERAVEIACDLIVTEPDLALELVERATKTDGGDNALDLAYAKLSFAALRAEDAASSTDVIESIRARIKDPRFKGFSAIASVLTGDHSAEQIIAEAERIEGASNRLQLLRQWAIENRARPDAVNVVDHALRFIIQTTTYAPNARVLRDLASPLPFSPNLNLAKSLVGMFDSQRVEAEKVGPTEDFVRLQLYLARTEAHYNFEAARNRLEETFLFVSYIDDLSIKANCEARYLSAITVMDPERRLETPDAALHSSVESDLLSDIDALLEATAEHNVSVRGIVRALAITKPDIALNIAARLNTEPRRDETYLVIIESATRAPDNKIDLPFLETVLGLIQDGEVRSRALLAVMQRLALVQVPEPTFLAMARQIIGRVPDIEDSTERCHAYCIAITFLKAEDAENSANLIDHLYHRLEQTWRAIRNGWEKVDTGFKIAEALADHAVEQARWYLAEVEAFRKEIAFDAAPTVHSYMACLMLAIRAYSGLLKSRLDTQEDLEHVTRLTRQIPSVRDQAELWNELALRACLQDRREISERLVNDHIKPLIDSIEGDLPLRGMAIVSVAAAVYVVNQRVAFEYIDTLEQRYRDMACSHICEFLLRKLPVTDAFDPMPHQGYQITSSDVGDICSVLERMENDSGIYHYVTAIADSLASSYGKKTFTAQQRQDAALRIKNLRDSKFPNPRYIRHQGYRVAVDAQVARIGREGLPTWTRLTDEARLIPNRADKSYVLSIIAGAMPSERVTERQSLLSEAKCIIEGIPVMLDRVDHLELLAEKTWRIDEAFAKSCLRSAMQFAVQTDTPEIYRRQRQIVDLAHRLDADLAASLASLADDDPARAAARINLRQRLKVLELNKQIASSVDSGDVLPKAPAKEFASACWVQLGRLNAGRASTLHFESLRDLVRNASVLPLTDAYPILAFAAENAARRWSGTPQGRLSLRPLFEATLVSTDLAERLAMRSAVTLERAKEYGSRASDDSNMLVRAGNREEAIRFVRDWLERNRGDYITIADPYFGPEDLDLVRLIASVMPRCEVRILTSRKHNEKVLQPWQDSYRTAWKEITDQEPPDTMIYFIGTQSRGDSPIHDRWWLTGKSGLRVGTSFNSLGLSKSSEISLLSASEASLLEQEVDQYVQRKIKDHRGERLSLTSCTL